MAVNLAKKYASKVDERFYKESQSSFVTNNDFKFSGVQTVVVYSIPTVTMSDYKRTNASNRYGTPSELQNNVQELTLSKDRSFTFTIDKGNKLQSQMIMDAGRALSRQIREVVVPEIDTYVFSRIAAAVTTANSATATVTKSNAYSLLLSGQEALGNANVPDHGRVCLCSYAFANFLKQDPAFMRYGDMSQRMLTCGVIGEVDGCKILKVPSSRLPSKCHFILCHPSATVAPKQLEEYKIHDNPPGISGWLVEGRVIYDCFVLDQKKDAIYCLSSSA